MLRREERLELNLREAVAEDVDRAESFAVEAGLVGEQAEAQMAVVALRGFGERGKVSGFEYVDAGERPRPMTVCP